MADSMASPENSGLCREVSSRQYFLDVLVLTLKGFGQHGLHDLGIESRILFLEKSQFGTGQIVSAADLVADGVQFAIITGICTVVVGTILLHGLKLTGSCLNSRSIVGTAGLTLGSLTIGGIISL